ncbi:MAG: hypothetical protein GXO50_00740 [Chlorobi bacterium]|nr:hypothetical protein [Chlorobiota bacterium]
METVTIPKDDYNELIELYKKILKKINKIEQIKKVETDIKKANVLKYCNTVSLKDDALKIQKQMRNEW